MKGDRYRVRMSTRWEWWCGPGTRVAERWSGICWETVYTCSGHVTDHATEYVEIASGGERPVYSRLIDYGQKWKMPRRR